MSYDNFDPAEIDKFSAHAHHWWDTEGVMKPLHDINPIRLGFIQSNAELNKQTLIDIGCGGGILSESLAKAGAKVTGIDMCPEMIELAKLHSLEQGLEVNYQKISAEEIAEQRPGQFDIVSCMEMLEHVNDPCSIVKACANLVKSGGKVFLSTINRNAKAYAFAVLGAEYVLRLLPRGTHQYSKFIKPSELSHWCRDAGLEVKIMKGMSYNIFSKSYALSDSLDVNYLVYAEKTE